MTIAEAELLRPRRQEHRLQRLVHKILGLLVEEDRRLHHHPPEDQPELLRPVVPILHQEILPLSQPLIQDFARLLPLLMLGNLPFLKVRHLLPERGHLLVLPQ